MIPEVLQQLIVDKAARYAAYSFSTDTFTVPMIEGTTIYAYALDIQLNVLDRELTDTWRLGANINADANRINRAWNIPEGRSGNNFVPLAAFYCWEFLVMAKDQGIAVNIGYVTNGSFQTGPAQAPELPRPIGYRTLPNIARKEELDIVLNNRAYFSNRNQVRAGTEDMNTLDYLVPINTVPILEELQQPHFVATLHCVVSNR